MGEVDEEGAVGVGFVGVEAFPLGHSWARAVEELEDQHLPGQYLPHQRCLVPGLVLE